MPVLARMKTGWKTDLRLERAYMLLLRRFSVVGTIAAEKRRALACHVCRHSRHDEKIVIDKNRQTDLSRNR